MLKDLKDLLSTDKNFRAIRERLGDFFKKWLEAIDG